MLEIFALPYLGVTGAIGWAIFEPFFRNNRTEPLTRAKIAISDLLAISLPVSMLFAIASWMMPVSIRLFPVQLVVVVTSFLFSATALVTGLFLVPKDFQVTFLKRMVVVGVIAPVGILVIIGWIGFLIWASFFSIMYLAPSMVVIAVTTVVLRVLSLWVCRPEIHEVEKAAEVLQ